jgi:putative ABC transport system permease protein
MLRDITLALRAFRRKPGVPLVIVLSLGAAMGLSTSLFSVVNATWFRPWSIDGVDQVRVVGLDVTVAEWTSWPRVTQSFAGLAATSGVSIAKLGREIVRPGFVSANYFDVLRVRMATGRGLREDDDADAAVISHLWWRRRFGGDPTVIGRTVLLDRIERDRPQVRLTVVGVAEPAFTGTNVINEHIWFGLRAASQFDLRAGRRLALFGRLAANATEDLARAELSVIARRYTERSQQQNVVLRTTDRFSISPPPIETQLRWASFVLGVAFIALIACANVANLLLARGHARRSEIALCMAIGGSRWALVRQLLIESLLLAMAAAAIGLAIASWLPSAVFRPLERLVDFHFVFPVDWRVFLWSAVMAVITCGAFGLVPALRSTDLTLNEGHDNAKRALMPSLLAWQAIVAVMAMVIAGLMLRSDPVAEARRTNTAVSGLTVVRLDTVQATDRAQRGAVVEAMFARLRALPATEAVAGMQEGELQPGGTQTLHVTADYFAALRIPLSSGRTFATGDASDEVVVNSAFADIHWRGRDAAGQLVPRPIRGRDPLAGRRVVGVVDDTLAANPTAYIPADAADLQLLFVRAPIEQVVAVGAAVTTALPSVATMEYIDGPDWATGIAGPGLLVAQMTSGFGLSALVLGVVGFFSLLEYAVQQRTREIGIRRALGARSGDIIRSLVIPVSRPMMRGLLLGAVGATITALFMQRAQLPSGIYPFDAITYAAVVILLTVAAALAAFVPVRRALRLEPMRALRVE